MMEAKSGRVLNKLVLIGVLLLVLLFLALALHRSRQRLSRAPGYHPRAVPVSWAVVKEGRLAMGRHYLARVESQYKADLSSRVTARVFDVRVDEGDQVHKGEFLVRLDDRAEQNQIATIQAKIQGQLAKIRSIQAELAAAQSDLGYLKREYERSTRLYGGKAISRSALDAAQNRYEVAKSRIRGLQNNIAGLEEGLKSLQADLRLSRIRLAYTRITAPFSGIVSRRYADPGDLAVPGRPLVQIFRPDKLRLVFELVQEDLSLIRPGQRVSLLWPEELVQASRHVEPLPAQAQISRIFPALEEGKTVRAEVDLGPLPGVRVGSFVPVEVLYAGHSGLLVPCSALVQDILPQAQAGANALYLIRQGRLQAVKVRVQAVSNDQALIQGPLKAGERVAVGDYLQYLRLAPGKSVEDGR